MIISHDYRFIFIRTFKTGGSSVAMSLARYLGPLDIITPDHADDELVRIRHGVFAQNFIFTKGRAASLDLQQDDETLKRKIEEIGESGFVPIKYFRTHNSAATIKECVGQRLWDGYTKFCIERNPFDYLISLYFWNLRKESYASVMDFLEQNKHTAHNWPLYTIDNKIAADIIIDYANLEAGLHRVAQQTGLPFDGWLPKLKGNVRSDRRPWHEFFSETEIEFIRQHWRIDIDLYSALINHADPRLRPQ